MILNFEIDETTGAKLDELARREHRSRRAQATKLLMDSLELLESDSFAPDTAEKKEAEA